MTAAELKASILDLAIRGKLVAQDPNAEPASELLARIAGEKAKLIKEKKIKKSKPLDPIVEDEIPFEVPDGWALCRLCEISESVGSRENQILAKEVKEQGAVPVVSQGQILVDGYCDDISKAISDVPVVMFGDHTRNVKYIDFPFVIGADGTKFFKSFADTKWLYYWTCYQSDQIRDRGYGRHWGLLNEKLVVLPPLAEQKRIVEKVEELMPLVERYEKAEAKRIELEKALPGDLEKSILQEAIQGKLVEQDPNDEPASELLARIAAEKAKLIKEKKIKKEKPLDPIDESEVPFALPKGWAWCRLGEICKTISGVSYQKGDVGKEKGVRILRGGNVKDGAAVILRDDDVWLPASYRDGENAVELGDVIVVASTGSSAVIGRPGIVRDKYDNAQIGAFLRIVRCNDKSCQEYIHLIFQSEYYRENIRKAVKGIGIKNLKAEYITTMVIPLPPLAEQKRIVAKVDELLGALKRLH